MQTEIKRFSDYRLGGGLEFNRLVKVADIEDVEITVLDVVQGESDYGPYVLFTFKSRDEDTADGCITSASVLMHKLTAARAQDLLPLRGKIVRRGRYWDIV